MNPPHWLSHSNSILAVQFVIYFLKNLFTFLFFHHNLSPHPLFHLHPPSPHHLGCVIFRAFGIHLILPLLRDYHSTDEKLKSEETGYSHQARLLRLGSAP